MNAKTTTSFPTASFIDGEWVTSTKTFPVLDPATEKKLADVPDLTPGAAAQSLSVGSVDVPARVATLLDEAKAAAKERRNLLDELARAEAFRLVSEAEIGAIIRAIFDGRDMEFAKKVASKVAGFGRAAVIGITNGTDGAIAMAATAVNCGAVLREVLSAAGARGGGSAEMAQGVCRAEQVEELLEELVQRLGV